MRVQIADPLSVLFEPKRYKVAYGGRDSTKSWGFARALLIKAYQEPLRILCAREIQDSIKDSVHKLLSDQIRLLGLADFYTIQNTSIKGANGSEFLFEGLRYNIDKIRSFEGVDIVWVEEANNVSKNSWDVLIPTIRKAGSEIWISFNPELETDETYRRFVLEKRDDSVVVKVTYKDNPWLSAESLHEIQHMQTHRPDDYLHVYEGNCKVVLEGTIYADELRTAIAESRITRVPYIDGIPVHTFWDFGFSDKTSCWFVQKAGFDYHVIDFIQDRLKKVPYYLQQLQGRGYVYGVDHMPHDAEHESLAAPSIRRQFEAAGRKCRVVERVKRKELGIAATRNVWPRLWFDEVKCADGLQALRHYRYEVDEHGQWSREPKHDENSHAADALRTLGESIGLPDKPKKSAQVQVVTYSKGEENAAWMG